MNKNIAINKYITLEYFANTYNSQHRGSYSDETIQYYIDNASIRVDNLINNPIWDFDSSEIWRQDLVKYAVAVMTEHWLKQGNNLSLQQISGTVGSISFSSDQSNLEYVPKLVLDLLIRAEARVSESFDADTEGTGDPNTYSPVFKTQQRLADVSIEEAPNDSLILLTKDETIKLLADASAGEFQFSTGEFLSSIGLEKVNSDDVIVYTKGVVDNMFVIRDNQITNLSQTKANVADVYTKGVIDTQQRDQDNLIKANTQKGNSNAAQINALKKILEAGGLTKEIFNSTANVTLSNTAYRLNPNIKIESNRPEMLTYVQETNYKKFIVKQNGLFEIDIVSTLKRIGTNIFTVSLELYDAATNTLLDTQDQEFNLTNTTTVNNQVGKISYKVSDISTTKLQREFYVSAKLLEIGATVTSATGSLIAASLLTDLGSGKVATTDDALNTSNVTGTTNTDALNTLNNDVNAVKAIAEGNTGAIELLNTNKADKTYVDDQLALKANSNDVYTKTETDNLISKSTQINTFKYIPNGTVKDDVVFRIPSNLYPNGVNLTIWVSRGPSGDYYRFNENESWTINLNTKYATRTVATNNFDESADVLERIYVSGNNGGDILIEFTNYEPGNGTHIGITGNFNIDDITVEDKT